MTAGNIAVETWKDTNVRAAEERKQIADRTADERKQTADRAAQKEKLADDRQVVKSQAADAAFVVLIEAIALAGERQAAYLYELLENSSVGSKERRAYNEAMLPLRPKVSGGHILLASVDPARYRQTSTWINDYLTIDTYLDTALDDLKKFPADTHRNLSILSQRLIVSRGYMGTQLANIAQGKAMSAGIPADLLPKYDDLREVVARKQFEVENKFIFKGRK